MDMMRDLSANIARVFKLIRRSLSPVGTDGGWGMVTPRSCSFAMGRFVCFAGGERQISAGASGIDPAGSMIALHAAFVQLVSASNGHSVVVKVFANASRGAALDAARCWQPSAWLLRLSSVVPRTHFWFG